jgi:hypothetical protein
VHILLIVLQLAASGSDAYFTHRNLTRPGFYEHDPIARPFVRDTPHLVGYFSADAAVKIGTAELLRKFHHRRISAIVSVGGITDSAYFASYSATH